MGGQIPVFIWESCLSIGNRSYPEILEGFGLIYGSKVQ
jgi:hypothetical protein